MPFVEGFGSSIMIETLESKLESFCYLLFLKKESTTEEVILKIEKELNKVILTMNKRDKISDQFYSKMRSTGWRSARLYGLDKVQ